MSEVIPLESLGTATPGKLANEVNEARALWRLRWTMLHSITRRAVQASRVQLMSIAAASLVLWLGLFYLFFEGFQFKGGIHFPLVATTF